MASDQGGRISWKDPDLVKIFIDSCLEEVNQVGKRGATLQKDSWGKIAKTIEEKKGLKMTQKQLRNEWDYLKKKYSVWSTLVKEAGNCFNSETNTVNWDNQQWADYIKTFPDAKQFRHFGLQWANELRALFDRITATEKARGSPSMQMVPADYIESSSTAHQIDPLDQIHIDVDAPSRDALSSNVGSDLPQEKRRKKNTDMSIIEDTLMAVLSTLKRIAQDQPTQYRGPSIEDCNKVLDEIQGLDESNPLYVTATLVFTESKGIRESWMSLSKKPVDVKLNWIAAAGKRFGYQ